MGGYLKLYTNQLMLYGRRLGLYITNVPHRGVVTIRRVFDVSPMDRVFDVSSVNRVFDISPKIEHTVEWENRS